ncbi:MAG: sigma-70 family RNA polymerase sigma factor [Phycisphaerales bacterium]|nr:sigma-70 family RNA polymerase sigma factor [Phycisphaerales bacterium]
MTHDTDMGGGQARFPHTRLTAIASLRAGDAGARRRALESVIACYWKPVYKHLRIKWRASNEEAKDLTQGFFAHVLEKTILDHYDASRGSFRTFLRTCLDGFVINERKAAARQKRGGETFTVSLDFEDAESEVRRHDPASPVDPDETFNREWMRSLFSLSVERLRDELQSSGRDVQFQLFHRYDLCERRPDQKLTYDDLAREFGLPVTQVTNFLAAARRELRRITLETLRDLTGSEEEFREEAARLM